MTAVPRVSVSSSVRMPMRPRVGTWNSRRTRPEPWFTIFDIFPLRRAIFSSTTPMYVSVPVNKLQKQMRDIVASKIDLKRFAPRSQEQE